MRTLLFVTCVATLAFWAAPSGAHAQDKKPVAEKHDSKALADSLRDVINTGADLFNLQGDYAGCYRLYQGALVSIKPFLTPELKQKIDQAITKAEGLPRFSDRAFELRNVIDEIRAHSKGTAVAEKTVVEPKSAELIGKKPQSKKPVTAAEPKKGPADAGTEGQVQGIVVYNGKPAPPGFLTLIGGDKRRFSASITDEGAYKFKTPIPPGAYRVAVERVPGAKIPAKLDIPERYRDENTSGLSVVVRTGSNMLRFELTQ